MPDEYEVSAPFYDAIYTSMKDYRREAERVRELIQKYGRRRTVSLLDVACGTGLHDQYLVNYYDVQGLDYSSPMLAVARKRLPRMVFRQGDMSNFDLGRQYDAVTCLFSAIGHMKSEEKMRAAIVCMANHVRQGGVLIVEPFIDPAKFDPARAGGSLEFVPDKHVARISTAKLAPGNVLQLEMLHFTNWDEAAGNARFFIERLAISMFTAEQFTSAFTDAGLEVVHDQEGLMGRGLYIGIKNS